MLNPGAFAKKNTYLRVEYAKIRDHDAERDPAFAVGVRISRVSSGPVISCSWLRHQNQDPFQSNIAFVVYPTQGHSSHASATCIQAVISCDESETKQPCSLELPSFPKSFGALNRRRWLEDYWQEERALFRELHEVAALREAFASGSWTCAELHVRIVVRDLGSGMFSENICKDYKVQSSLVPMLRLRVVSASCLRSSGF